MTEKGSVPKKHHYIPQGILNNFTRKGMLYWYSKERQIQKKQKPEKVGFIKNFYNYTDSERSLETEFFTTIDSDAPIVINKIIESKSLKNITMNEKAKLIKYIASQIIRIPKSFEQMKVFEETIKKEIHPDISISINDDIHTTYLNGIIENTIVNEKILNEKIITLHVAKDNEEYIIGDNPVLSFNKINQKDVLIVSNHYPPTIKYQIYFFPISHNLMLSFVDNDKSLINDFFFYKENHNKFQFCLSNDLVFSRTERTLNKELQNFYDASFEVIKNIAPQILKTHNLKKGEKLHLLKSIFTLSTNVRRQILDLYIKSKK